MEVALSSELPINTEGDIVLVRKAIREAAKVMGFAGTDITRIVTAASELARNISKYAGTGRVLYRQEYQHGQRGIAITFLDKGPGIVDITTAMLPGFSSSDGLGLGLPGARRLMDRLEIDSMPNHGTTVMIWKGLPG